MQKVGKKKFTFTGRVWLWQMSSGSLPAHCDFVTTDEPTSLKIHYATLGLTGGFGSVRVRATIGATTWETSVFPHRESGGWVLPLKAEVRKREGIHADDEITVLLEV